MQGLGDLAGGSFSSSAYAASADGDVIVGDGQSASGQEPFRWTSAGGMVGLGHLPGDTAGFGAAVSADGSVVVGVSSKDHVPQAFR
jgi:probable HAF family extracellular repeat protein